MHNRAINQPHQPRFVENRRSVHLGRLEGFSDLINFHRRCRFQNLRVEIVDVRSDRLRCEMRGADAIGVDDFVMIYGHDTGRVQFLLHRRCGFNRGDLLLRRRLFFALSALVDVEVVAFASDINRLALLHFHRRCHNVRFGLKPAVDDRLVTDVVGRVVCVSREVSRWVKALVGRRSRFDAFSRC